MLINPWIFYLIGVCDSISIVCVIMCAVSVFCALACISIAYNEEEFSYTADESKKFKNNSKRFIMLFVVCLLGAIFVPSKDTTTKMLIASQVNETNVERAKEVIDYIVEKMQEVKR